MQTCKAGRENGDFLDGISEAVTFERDATEVAKGPVQAPGGREHSKRTGCGVRVCLAWPRSTEAAAGTWASGREGGD